MSDEDDDSKTEDPTPKKLEDAAKKGQSPQSREMGSFFILLAMAFMVAALLPSISLKASMILAPFIQSPEDMRVDMHGVGATFRHLMASVFVLMILPIALVILAALAPNIVMNKWRVTAEPMKPKLDRISPLAGFKRIFSRRSVVELLKGIIKMIIVGVVVVMAVWPYKESLRILPDMDAVPILDYALTLATRVMMGVVCLMFLIAIADYLYQRFEFMKSMRMTKQEIKDEYKQSEGDPQIKGRIRQLRIERSRQRMMAAVPEADVIVTNPTHYAVALKYESGKMAAPMVVAKGIDNIAQKIREVAEEHRVPIIRNPPLARVLHDTTDIEEEVPFEHYKAVAEVIGYVYRLKGMKLNPSAMGKQGNAPPNKKPKP